MAWKKPMLKQTATGMEKPAAGRADEMLAICPKHGMPMTFAGWVDAMGVECEVWVCWRRHAIDRFDGADMTILWPRGFHEPEGETIDMDALWEEVRLKRPHFTADSDPIDDALAGWQPEGGE